MASDSPDVWPDDADSEDRVRVVAEQFTRPRSASWVADQARVDYKTARKYLEKLVGDDRLRTTERDRTKLYYPDPRQQFFEEIGDLVETNTKDELTAELSAMGDRIESWQDEYGVETSDELRTTLDETLSVEERRERERVIEDWEYTREMRMLVRHAIQLYDDLQRFTAANSPVSAEATGRE